MKQANLIKKMKQRGFALKFKDGAEDKDFCVGLGFPNEPPFEDNERFFAEHRDFIKTLNKGEWEGIKANTLSVSK